MQFNIRDTALVVIDPQNDVLSEKGVSWSLVGESARQAHTNRHSRKALASSSFRSNRSSDDALRRLVCRALV